MICCDYCSEICPERGLPPHFRDALYVLFYPVGGSHSLFQSVRVRAPWTGKKQRAFQLCKTLPWFLERGPQKPVFREGPFKSTFAPSSQLTDADHQPALILFHPQSPLTYKKTVRGTSCSPAADLGIAKATDSRCPGKNETGRRDLGPRLQCLPQRQRESGAGL